jgi:hypothetical protein
MTTIIGVQLEHGCVIVSDSRIAASGKVYTHPDMVKAVQRGHYLIAGAGDYRALQIVLHGWTPPALTIKARENLYEFMIKPIKKGGVDTKCVIKKVCSCEEDNFEEKLLEVKRPLIKNINDP